MTFWNEKGEKLLLVNVSNDKYVWINESGKLCMITILYLSLS